MPENTGNQQNKTKFEKGKSGNPLGRPVGARNRASLMAEKLFSDDLKGVCESVITSAKSGNIQAAKIILDRLLPPRKDNPISIGLPEIRTSSDILTAMGVVTSAIATGKISPSEGEALARIIEIHTKALELYEFENRLTQLEIQANTNENRK